MINIEERLESQLKEIVSCLKSVLGEDLLGCYLYSSAVLGGLQKYSDVDIFVVLNRPTTSEEKKLLIKSFLEISGEYMKGDKQHLEITVVSKEMIIPWEYPPSFDFQYGEWHREEFINGVFEPWSHKKMPDLAVIITNILLKNEKLYGEDAEHLLPNVPYNDFIQAMIDELDRLSSEILDDTRNVLLTCARIWSTLKTDAIHSKPEAASWAIKILPKEHVFIMERARSICLGLKDEFWDGIASNKISSCVEFMLGEIRKEALLINARDNTNRTIHLMEPWN